MYVEMSYIHTGKGLLLLGQLGHGDPESIPEPLCGRVSLQARILVDLSKKAL